MGRHHRADAPAEAGNHLTRVQAALLVAGFTALLVLPPVGRRNLAASDEVRFALAARHVLEHGVGFGIKIRQTYFREKPPLYSWMIAGLSWPGRRVTPTAAQIPVGVAAVVTVVATFLLGERLFDRRIGLWAALVLATTYGFFSHSQYLLPDMMVVAFMGLASYAFWLAMHDPPGRGARVAFYFAMALAVYSKGPMGLIPVVVGGLWIGMEYGWREIPRRLWSPIGIALFVAISLSWLGPFLALGAGSLATEVLAKDWLRRYLGPPAFRKLALDTIVVLLPWTIVAPMVLTAAFRARGTPSMRFALLSCVVPWLLLLPVENLRTRYMLPVAPGLALLVAWWLNDEARRPTPIGRFMSWVGLVATTAVVLMIVQPAWFGLHAVYFGLVTGSGGAARARSCPGGPQRVVGLEQGRARIPPIWCGGGHGSLSPAGFGPTTRPSTAVRTTHGWPSW